MYVSPLLLCFGWLHHSRTSFRWTCRQRAYFVLFCYSTHAYFGCSIQVWCRESSGTSIGLIPTRVESFVASNALLCLFSGDLWILLVFVKSPTFSKLKTEYLFYEPRTYRAFELLITSKHVSKKKQNTEIRKSRLIFVYTSTVAQVGLGPSLKFFAVATYGLLFFGSLHTYAT